VVGEINAGCGACRECLTGDPRHCQSREVLGILGLPGAFAEELQLPHENLLPLPDTVSDESAVFVEPLAAALAVLEARVQKTMPARALVVGDGRLGILIACALGSRGVLVTVAGRHPERSRFLPAHAQHVTDLLEEDSPPGKGEWDFVVEASGDTRVLARALTFVAPRGTLVLKTTTEAPAQLDTSRLVVDEIRLVGSRCGRFAPALELLERIGPNLEALITERFPLERADRALSAAREPGALKILIEMDG